MFNNLKVSVKLALLVGLNVIGSVLVLVIAMHLSFDQMIDDRVGKVRALVDTAIGVANSLDKQVQEGAFSKDEAIVRFRDTINRLRFDADNNYIFSYDFNGVAVANVARPDFVGKNMMDLQDKDGFYLVRKIVEVAKSGKGDSFYYRWPRAGTDVPIRKLTYAAGFQPWGIAIAAGVYVDDVDAAFGAQLETLLIAVVPLTLIMLAIAFAIRNSLAGGLTVLSKAMRQLASGDTTVAVPQTDRLDELGDMSKAIVVFKESMIERERLAQQRLAEEAAKEQRTRALTTLNEGFSVAFQEVGDGIVNASVAVDTDSKTLVTSAQRTREQADAVARASAGASSNVQTVASAAEQLRASIAEINQQVVSAATASTQAVEQSARAGETVKGLAVAADRIGQVVDLINSIASQTNLLALNATIEAARAGDAGKGFAVVAAEVKGLANQTANATGEIQAQVGAIQQETVRAVEAITEIGKTIASIQEITTSVAGAVEQQSAATAEISRSVQQASLGSQEVAQAIELVSSATDTTAFAIDSLRVTSEQLSTHARLLQTQVTDFVAQARAI